MAITKACHTFRMQTYRLAWLFVFSMLVVFILMWFFGHDANHVLGKFGIGLFFAATMASILCRRFAPFFSALGVLALIFGSICA